MIGRRDNLTQINRFSPHLFWDVKKEKIDIARDKKFIVERVMNYGTDADEAVLFRIYPFWSIKRIVLKLESLNERTLCYLSAVFNVEEKKFKCYGKKPFYLNY